MNIITPRQAINKAYRRLQIPHEAYSRFLNALEVMTGNIRPNSQDEEEQKNKLAIFLRDAFYAEHDVCAVRPIDLAIRLTNSSTSPIAVMFEVKGINRPDMPSASNINTKALQELLLYYLRQRAAGNVEVRHLVITNTRDFFIFDASEFERLFYSDKDLVRQFNAFEAGSLPKSDTEYFYSNIAKPAISRVHDIIRFTYFSLEDYKTDIAARKTSGKLPDLFRLLSPNHLIKIPFQNDSNTLNRRFYKELLHLIGIQEVIENGKTLIRRLAPEERNPASLLENTLRGCLITNVNNKRTSA